MEVLQTENDSFFQINEVMFKCAIGITGWTLMQSIAYTLCREFNYLLAALLTGLNIVSLKSHHSLTWSSAFVFTRRIPHFGDCPWASFFTCPVTVSRWTATCIGSNGRGNIQALPLCGWGNVPNSTSILCSQLNIISPVISYIISPVLKGECHIFLRKVWQWPLTLNPFSCLPYDHQLVNSLLNRIWWRKQDSSFLITWLMLNDKSISACRTSPL